ncbi:MAG: histidine phosphatase family protein [Mesorhizobium sp.]
MLRFALLLSLMFMGSVASATEAGWALLRDGGHVVLLRNAYATGATDPANVDRKNCSTQRNLSERGKQQARKIGSLFAARAAPTEKVLASGYCRTLETARIAFGDRLVETADALDPLLGAAADAPANPDALAAIADWDGGGNLVLVTHLDVIRQLTGITPREGEALIVKPNGETLHVLARIVF